MQIVIEDDEQYSPASIAGNEDAKPTARSRRATY